MRRTLRIVSVEAVAEKWLLPRLASFKAAVPSINSIRCEILGILRRMELIEGTTRGKFLSGEIGQYQRPLV